MSEYLERYEGPIGQSRNGTERSAVCETILDEFMSKDMQAALVRWRKTEYTVGELYQCMKALLRKPPYKGAVSVSKRGDENLILTKPR